MGVVVVVVSNWNRISLVELLFYRRRQQLEKRTKRRQSDSRGEKSTSSSSSSSTSSSQTGRWISFFLERVLYLQNIKSNYKLLSLFVLDVHVY